MTSTVTINRLPTGVPGLDTVLGGGIPEFSFHLIAGQPGCGKTTLAHQIMFALATPQRPALYFTVLGEPALKMLRYQQQFDFFDTEALNTTFLIGEYFSDADPNPVFTVADGLIWMRQSVQRNSMVRKLEIMKLRGQPTLPVLHSFRIGPSGIAVFAPPSGLPGQPGPGPAAHSRRLGMGVPGLDAMLGGGLPSGYSLLVGAVRARNPTRVVIDSLSGFELALAPTFREDFRESLLQLVTALSAAGVTVLMTSELEDRYTDLRFSLYGTAFLTDAIIEQQVAQMTRLVGDLLDVSRLGGDGPLLAHGNAERLAQIIDNLIDNAAKDSHDHGQIKVCLAARDDKDPRGRRSRPRCAQNGGVQRGPKLACEQAPGT